MIVAFCGLPSSGKSSLINSLIGKRILQAGVCRTTKEPALLTGHPIIDDDKCKFVALDLPGICDSEEKESNVFNDMTRSEIVKASVIFFVSDVHKAFMTTHEVSEYKKLKKYLEDLREDTGKLYYLAIILSKCDVEDVSKEKKIKKEKSKTKYLEEISDPEEDTDLRDLIEGVKEKMKGNDIILFNSFGRINKDSNAGPELKEWIKKRSGYISCYNTQFTIKKYYENYDQKQEISYYDTFSRKNIQYDGCNTNDIAPITNKLVDIYTKLTNRNKTKLILSLTSGTAINFRRLLLISKLLEKNANIHTENHDAINLYKFNHCVHMINNNNLLLKQYNYFKNYTSDEVLNELIPNAFLHLSTNTQKIIISKIIYGDGLLMSDGNCARFLNLTFFQSGGFVKYEFKKTFNEFITNTTDRIKFMITYNRLSYFCNYKLKNFDTNTPSVLNCSANEIKQVIKIYFVKLRENILDPMYILKNKLIILCSLFNNPDGTHNDRYPYDLFRQKLKCGTSLEKRIYNSPEFKEIDKLFFENLVNKDVLINYSDTDGLEFISTYEMMYNLIPLPPPKKSSQTLEERAQTGEKIIIAALFEQIEEKQILLHKTNY